MTRIAPLAMLAALAALACTPSVAPPQVPASASPSAAASAAASTTPASTTPSPAASAAASPAASPSAGASPNPAAGGTEPDAHEAEACEHMEEGPGVAVTANLVTMSRERARVEDDHKRYDVGLVQNAGQYEGYVIFENAEAGAYEFFLNKDVPFKLMQAGKEITPTGTATQVGGCPEVIKKLVEADLAVGQVELHFGPTTESTVGLVFEHHHTDDE